jgi:hypothetical protein
MFLTFLSEHVHLAIRDSGPVYYETAVRSGIIEPWNSFSSLIYLLPALWFLIRLYPKYTHHSFLVYFATPLLIAGGIGSTLYHAFRSSDVLMWLDVAPIFVLTLSLGAYFYWLSSRNYTLAFLFLFSFVLIRFAGFRIFELQTAINVSYFLTGIYIFVPAWLLLRKIQYRGFSQIILSVIMFGVALFMRWYDDFEYQLFSAGTHWLWHIFSAAGAFFLGEFLVSSKKTVNPPGIKYLSRN